MTHQRLELTVGGSAAAALGFFLILMAWPAASFAGTQWDVGVSGGNHGIDGFHLSIGDYYDVPEREVVVVHDRGIDDDELPVVFFLAREAHVPPEVIVDMRIRGMSWWDISLHYGIGPEIYYVPVPVYVERHYPHGHAYGYYRDYRRREDWRRIHLNDRDIVNQVNLRFMKDHYRYEPDRVMRYRSEGKRFSAIDREIWRERQGKDRARYYDNRDWRHSNDKHDKQWSKDQKSRSKAQNENIKHGGNNNGHGNAWQYDQRGDGKGH
jgi:hypothetical protein